MTQENNIVIYVVSLGAEAKRFTHRRCKVFTRWGGKVGEGKVEEGDGESKFEIEARQKLQHFSTNDVTHQNR